jgi:hypothetical protein
MIRFLNLSAIALAGLLLLSACQTVSTPEVDSLPAATAVAPTVTLTTPSSTTSTAPTVEEKADTVTPTATVAAPLGTPSPVQATAEEVAAVTPTATILAPTSTPSPVPASEGTGNADVVYVEAVQAADGSWTFHVTVEHPDTGWEDYADGWDVLTPDGEVLKADAGQPFTRLLAHPHVGEQPFRRSQSGLIIPAGVTWVRVRAHDMVDGWGGREIIVDLTATVGEGFEVIPLP